jgi:T-complex protein 1 subunit eta
MERVNQATGSSTQSTSTDIQDRHLGTCGTFEERQIGGERFNIFSECPEAKTCTLVLRGGAEQFIAEVERSLHDAIMIVKRALRNTTIVAGGGACEMELSSYLHDFADRNVPHKQQAVVKAFAKALEVIPRQLCDNAGFDATDILNRLRVEHRKGNVWAGVDFDNEGVRDNMEAFVWEPSLVKVNAIQAAVEAACLIMSVDETISTSSPYPNPTTPVLTFTNCLQKNRERGVPTTTSSPARPTASSCSEGTAWKRTRHAKEINKKETDHIPRNETKRRNKMTEREKGMNKNKKKVGLI